MIVTALSFIVAGYTINELVRCVIRHDRAVRGLDLASDEAWHELREAYGRAAQECALANAMRAARRAIHGQTIHQAHGL